jgi:hypothetical protein
MFLGRCVSSDATWEKERKKDIQGKELYNVPGTFIDPITHFLWFYIIYIMLKCRYISIKSSKKHYL